jgi:hypothetical protein
MVARPRTPTRSTQRSVQEALARHWRDSARASPAAPYPRVVLLDKVSWYRGPRITAVREAWPPLVLSPLPSDRVMLAGVPATCDPSSSLPNHDPAQVDIAEPSLLLADMQASRHLPDAVAKKTDKVICRLNRLQGIGWPTP